MMKSFGPTLVFASLLSTSALAQETPCVAPVAQKWDMTRIRTMGYRINGIIHEHYTLELANKHCQVDSIFSLERRLLAVTQSQTENASQITEMRVATRAGPHVFRVNTTQFCATGSQSAEEKKPYKYVAEDDLKAQSLFAPSP